MDRPLEQFNYDRLGNSIFVVGIDIGSVSSGYAFASREDIMHDPPKFSTHYWQGSQLLSSKCPTVILLDINEETKAFGFEAEEMYSEFLEQSEHDGYYYFKYFRDQLHLQREAGNVMIKDVSGKPLKAVQVMGQTIGYLKHQAMNKINQRLKVHADDDDLYFVLTVPATWNDQERHFMKQASHVAGIKEHKLSIVCESEAALLFISTTKTSLANTNALMKSIKNGEKYMVIDIGGTLKVTYRSHCQNETVQDIVSPSGIPWGGKSVDDAFYAFLCEICGTQIMEYLRLEENDDYIDLFREFQTKKHSIRSYQQNKVVINLPVSLIELVRQKHRRFERAIEQSPYKETVMFSKLKLHISPDTFRGLFEPSIRAIIKHFAEMQKNPKVEDINILGLVGGFVECELVHNAVSSYFGNSKSILVPEDARTAVMKGAVLYAFQPKAKTDLLLSKISKMHGNDFKDLISKGDFASYENRVYLAGACNIGKSSLASILIGEVVPTKWHSTDGLVIHFGRNGIHLEDKKMIPLGQSDTNILKKLLLGNPNVEAMTTDNSKLNLPTNIQNRIQEDSQIETASNLPSKYFEHDEKAIEKLSTAPDLTITTENPTKKQDLQAVELKVEQHSNLQIPHVTNQTHTSIQSDVLQEIRHGKYKIRVAPSDLVDFGGQRSFDMTHQLFIQHKGTFVLMFDGRYGLHSPLKEYPQGDITAKGRNDPADYILQRVYFFYSYAMLMFMVILRFI